MKAYGVGDRNLVCLRTAVLCANCEIISEPLNGHCAGCGSQALMRLGPLLGGTIESDVPLAFATSHIVNETVPQLFAAA
jgi:hypothetical protein